MLKNANTFDLFQLIEKKDFDKLAEKWKIDKWVRELDTWKLTKVLITAMVHRLESFREVEQVLAIPRSTLSDALARRCSGFFMELCDQILLRIYGQIQDRKSRQTIREILAIDSSEVRVHGSMFSTPRWRQRNRYGRQAAAKIHLVWNVDGGWIDDYIVTGSCQNDSPASKLLRIRSGCTYVFDRAYTSVNFWTKIMDKHSHFITRLKQRSVNTIKLPKSVVNSKENGILHDGVYKPTGTTTRCKMPRHHLETKFRFIIYRDSKTKKTFYFVTSDWNSSAEDIAEVYKQRWSVELLFRWLKGHLKIRHLPTKNINAAKVQLAVAVLIQLLLKLKQTISKFSGTPWEMLRELRTSAIKQSLSRQTFPRRTCRGTTPAEGLRVGLH